MLLIFGDDSPICKKLQHATYLSNPWVVKVNGTDFRDFRGKWLRFLRRTESRLLADLTWRYAKLSQDGFRLRKNL